MHKSLAKGFRLHATDGQICNKTHREEIFRDSILSYTDIHKGYRLKYIKMDRHP